MNQELDAKGYLLRNLAQAIEYENDGEISAVLRKYGDARFRPERRSLYLLLRALVTERSGEPCQPRKIHDLISEAIVRHPSVLGGSMFTFILDSADLYLHALDPVAFPDRCLYLRYCAAQRNLAAGSGGRWWAKDWWTGQLTRLWARARVYLRGSA